MCSRHHKAGGGGGTPGLRSAGMRWATYTLYPLGARLGPLGSLGSLDGLGALLGRELGGYFRSYAFLASAAGPWYFHCGGTDRMRSNCAGGRHQSGRHWCFGQKREMSGDIWRTAG